MGKICQKAWEEFEKKGKEKEFKNIEEVFAYSNDDLIKILDKYKPCVVAYKEFKEEIENLLKKYESLSLHHVDRGLEMEIMGRRFANQLQDNFIKTENK